MHPKATLLLGVLLLAVPAIGRAQPSGSDVAEGKRVYRTANCVGCHKWHGGGGGGYGRDALSLRRTQLDRDQIMQTVPVGDRAPACLITCVAPTMRMPPRATASPARNSAPPCRRKRHSSSARPILPRWRT